MATHVGLVLALVKDVVNMEPVGVTTITGASSVKAPRRT
jgi:hypothetical protein